MSVCFLIYRPNKEIKYLGCPYYLSTLKRDKLEEYINSDKCENNFFEKVFSDGEKHDIFEITGFTYKSSQGKAYNRYYKKFLKRFKNDLVYINQKSYGIMRRMITVDRVAYRQGWFLKRRFFKRYCTSYLGFTKKEMNNFFIKYLDSSERALECIKIFNKIFQDGDIFECSF